VYYDGPTDEEARSDTDSEYGREARPLEWRMYGKRGVRPHRLATHDRLGTVRAGSLPGLGPCRGEGHDPELADRLFSSYLPLRLSAKPAKGWRFKSWQGACRGTRAVCTLLVSRNFERSRSLRQGVTMQARARLTIR